MSARDLAIGLLLGGGGGDIAFHEIINNSVALQTIPIDNTYHFTFNMMQISPDYCGTSTDYLKTLHFTGSNNLVSNVMYGTDSNGTLSSKFVSNMFALSFTIAWENDVPVFAVFSYGVNFTGSWGGGIDNGKYVILPRNTWEFDVENAIVPNLSLWKPGDTQFQNYLYNADDNYSTLWSVTVPYIAKEWNYETDAQGIYAYLYRAIPGETSFYAAGTIFGFQGNVFTDLPITQYFAKYNDIVTAINAANGVNYRPAQWGRIYDSRPQGA